MIINKIRMDFQNKGQPPVLYAVQGDSLSRAVAVTLLDGGQPYELPDPVSVSVRFGKPDGTGGVYDTLPNGQKCWSVDGNVLTVIMAPQVFTCPGRVAVQVAIRGASSTISTFNMNYYVEADPSFGKVASEDYLNLSDEIAQNVNKWLDDHPEATTTVQDGTITEEKLAPGLLDELYDIRKGYDGKEYVSAGAAVREQVSVAMAMKDNLLTPDMKTLILTLFRACVYTSNMSPTIDALEASFQTGGGIYCTVFSRLLNVTIDNDASTVERGSAYTATLTAAEGYELRVVTVTMGGTDVTAQVYAEGVIHIPEVTGNVEIIAAAAEVDAPGIYQIDGTLFIRSGVTVTQNGAVLTIR